MPVIDEVLFSWQCEELEFALVSPTTTTDGCFRSLAEAGIKHELVKVNAVDRLLHGGSSTLERVVPILRMTPRKL